MHSILEWPGQPGSPDTGLLARWKSGEFREAPGVVGEAREHDAVFVVAPEAPGEVPLAWFCAPCLVADGDAGLEISPPHHLPTPVELGLLDFLDKNGAVTSAHTSNWFQTVVNPLSLMEMSMDMTIFVETPTGWRVARCKYALNFLRYSRELLESRAFPDGSHQVQDVFETHVPPSTHPRLRRWLDAKLRAILRTEHDARAVDAWLASWKPDMGRIVTEDDCALLVRDADKRTRRLAALAGLVCK